MILCIFRRLLFGAHGRGGDLFVAGGADTQVQSPSGFNDAVRRLWERRLVHPVPSPGRAPRWTGIVQGYVPRDAELFS